MFLQRLLQSMFLQYAMQLHPFLMVVGLIIIGGEGMLSMKQVMTTNIKNYDERLLHFILVYM